MAAASRLFWPRALALTGYWNWQLERLFVIAAQPNSAIAARFDLTNLPTRRRLNRDRPLNRDLSPALFALILTSHWNWLLELLF